MPDYKLLGDEIFPHELKYQSDWVKRWYVYALAYHLNVPLMTTDMTPAEYERERIREALIIHKGNKTHAAEQVKMNVKTIYAKMKQWGWKRSDFE